MVMLEDPSLWGFLADESVVALGRLKRSLRVEMVAMLLTGVQPVARLRG